MKFMKDVIKLGVKTTAVTFGICYGLNLAARLCPKEEKEK